MNSHKHGHARNTWHNIYPPPPTCRTRPARQQKSTKTSSRHMTERNETPALIAQCVYRKSVGFHHICGTKRCTVEILRRCLWFLCCIETTHSLKLWAVSCAPSDAKKFGWSHALLTLHLLRSCYVLFVSRFSCYTLNLSL